MNFQELLLVAAGLAMDAFAVAVCKGLAAGAIKARFYWITGLWFGGFQGLMPLIGFYLGSTFAEQIDTFSHWIAFGLLTYIGIRMIKEGASGKQEKMDASFALRPMLLMAIATSIDALAVGITFSLLPDIEILWACAIIGFVTFVLSMLGLKIGSVFGSRFKGAAEIAGGAILVAMGIRLLVSA